MDVKRGAGSGSLQLDCRSGISLAQEAGKARKTPFLSGFYRYAFRRRSNREASIKHE